MLCEVVGKGRVLVRREKACRRKDARMGERNVGEKCGKGGAKGENVAWWTQQEAIALLSAFVECLTDGAPDPTRVGQLREEALKA